MLFGSALGQKPITMILISHHVARLSKPPCITCHSNDFILNRIDNHSTDLAAKWPIDTFSGSDIGKAKVGLQTHENVELGLCRSQNSQLW